MVVSSLKVTARTCAQPLFKTYRYTVKIVSHWLHLVWKILRDIGSTCANWRQQRSPEEFSVTPQNDQTTPIQTPPGSVFSASPHPLDLLFEEEEVKTPRQEMSPPLTSPRTPEVIKPQRALPSSPPALRRRNIERSIRELFEMEMIDLPKLREVRTDEQTTQLVVNGWADDLVYNRERHFICDDLDDGRCPPMRSRNSH